MLTQLRPRLSVGNSINNAARDLIGSSAIARGAFGLVLVLIASSSVQISAILSRSLFDHLAPTQVSGLRFAIAALCVFAFRTAQTSRTDTSIVVRHRPLRHLHRSDEHFHVSVTDVPAARGGNHVEVPGSIRCCNPGFQATLPSALRSARLAGGNPHCETFGLLRPRGTGSQDWVDYYYVNHALVNGAVVMCEFEDPRDAIAHSILQGAYPGRQAVGVDARTIFALGGGIHCITQQQPLIPD